MRRMLFVGVLISMHSVFAYQTWYDSSTKLTWTYYISNEEVVIGSNYAAGPTALPTSTSGTITIPSSINGRPVTMIDQWAFWGCKQIATIKIPEGVKKIGLRAFLGCTNLSYIYIPSTLTDIGYDAFSGCNSLWNIIVAENNQSFSTYFSSVLHNNEMTVLIRCPQAREAAGIQYCVTNIEDYAFQNCNIKSIYIPANVKRLGNYAFQNCSITNLVIADGIKHISKSCFDGCDNLLEVTIPASVENVGYSAFGSCSKLRNVKITQGVKCIGGGMFTSCYCLSEIMIPPSVTNIGNSAFAYCYSLTNVTIGCGVLSIGYYAFDLCSKLKSIDFEGAPPAGIADACIPINAAIRYSDRYTSQWLRVVEDCGFTNAKPYRAPLDNGGPYTEIVDGVEWTFTVNNFGSFIGVGGSTAIDTETSGKLYVPGKLGGHPVVQIQSYAFSECSLITDVIFPATVTNVQKRVFNYCTALKYVEFPASLQYLDNATFRYASNVEKVFFGGDAPCVDNIAFKHPSPSFSVYVTRSSYGWDPDKDGCWMYLTLYYVDDMSVKYMSALDMDDVWFDVVDSSKWVIDTATKYYGGSSIRTPSINHDNSSFIQATVVGPKVVSFMWRTDCEEDYDELTLFVDGTKKRSISGQDAVWQKYTMYLEEGSHTLMWKYAKDGSCSKGEDCGWIDCLNIIDPLPETIQGNIVIEYLPDGIARPILLNNNWMIKYGVAKENDTTSSALLKMSENGKNGVPRYQSYILGMEPDSDVPAEEQLKVMINGFDENGVPIINYEPTPNDASHVTIKKLGRKTLSSSDGWEEVSDGSEADYNFFRVSAEIK